MASGAAGITQRVLAGVRGLGPCALDLAQALAVLGDGCELRHAVAMVGLEMPDAIALAAGSFAWVCWLQTPLHASCIRSSRCGVQVAGGEQRDAAHRSAAGPLHADGAPPGLVAAHLVSVQPVGDGWVVERLRDAARAAMRSGAPEAAAGLLSRALAEPPALARRVDVLREAARAQASAGGRSRARSWRRHWAFRRRAGARGDRARGGGDVGAVSVGGRGRRDRAGAGELGEANEELAARLEGELVVCSLHDARRASRVGPAPERLSSRSLAGSAVEALAVAQGMRMVLAGRPADEAAAPLKSALARAKGPVETGIRAPPCCGAW